MTDPLDFIGKRYASCWHFATAFYGLSDNKQLENFEPVKEPVDGDYFLVFRAGRVYHCGIFAREGYLHQQFPQQGVVFTKQGFSDVRYYRPHATVRNGTHQ